MFCVIFDFDGPIFNGKAASLNALKATVISVLNDEAGNDLQEKMLALPLLTPDVLIPTFFYDRSSGEQTQIKQKYIESLVMFERKQAVEKTIIEILELLKRQNGIITILYTNRKYDNVYDLLVELGLIGYFDEIYGRDTICPKPKPDTLEFIIKKHKLEARDVLFIGDSDYDYMCAKSCEIRYYHANYSNEISYLSWSKADYVVNDPKELLGILSKFNVRECQGQFTSIPQNLKDAISLNRLSIFCGAGISIPSGVGNWHDEYYKVFEKSGLLYLLRNEDIPEALQLAVSDREKAANLFDEFRHLFELGNNKEPNEYHYAIINANTKTIWTTNYDFLFEAVINSNNVKVKTIHDDKELFNNVLYNRCLVKMNGDFEYANFCENGSWNLIFTQEQFDLFEVERVELAKKFENEYKSNSFVFVGISLSDPALKRMLSIIKRRTTRLAFCHYLLVKEERDPAKQYLQTLQKEKLARYGITTIFFNDYSNIIAFVEAIAVESRIQKIGFCGNLPDEIVKDECYDGSIFSAAETEEFCSKTAKKLAIRNHKIISGCAPWVGIPAVESAFNVNSSLAIYYLRKGGGTKFKANAPALVVPESSYKEMRETLTDNCDILLAVAGRICAFDESGLVQEIEIAIKKNIPVLLFPQFGGVIKKYYNDLINLIKAKYSNVLLRENVVELNIRISKITDKSNFRKYYNNQLVDDIEGMIQKTKGYLVCNTKME